MAHNIAELMIKINRRYAPRFLVKGACEVAAAKDHSLIDIVRQQFGEIAPKNKIDWQALVKLENYLGQTEHFIDRVLEQVKKY